VLLLLLLLLFITAEVVLSCVIWNIRQLLMSIRHGYVWGWYIYIYIYMCVCVCVPSLYWFLELSSIRVHVCGRLCAYWCFLLKVYLKLELFIKYIEAGLPKVRIVKSSESAVSRKRLRKHAVVRQYLSSRHVMSPIDTYVTIEELYYI
jgi:hypothetical protein